MKIKILGSGAWEGVPAPFCGCRVCKLAKEKPNSKDNRTRPSIQVINNNKSFLIEISPDIRIQYAKFNLPFIRDFLVTHWHFDHLYGLLELHSAAKFIQRPTIYCSQKTSTWIRKNFSHIKKNVVVLKAFQKFKLNGVEITPFPVYHMIQEDKQLKVTELKNAFGFLLESNNKKVAYLADYFKIPNKSINLIKQCDVLLADGTYLFEEYGSKKVKEDKDHLHGEKIFDAIKPIKAKKVIFHSISHLSRKTKEELQEKLPKGMLISYDGYEVI